MSGFSDFEPAEEFITITLDNVAAQCDAVLEAVKPKHGSNYAVPLLLSAYCGILIYRAYRSRRAKQEMADAINAIEVSSDVEVTENLSVREIASLQEPEPLPLDYGTGNQEKKIVGSGSKIVDDEETIDGNADEDKEIDGNTDEDKQDEEEENNNNAIPEAQLINVH